MYNIKEALSVEISANNFIKPGIQENVKLSGVRTDSSINGNLFIEFSFKKANVGTATHTEWEPVKFDGMSDEDFRKKCKNQTTRITQILLCFYTKQQLEEMNPSFSDFKGLIDFVKSLLDKADTENTLLRVKFIYNNKDYISLPQYSMFTFIEPMSISADESKIRILTNIDKLQKSIEADVETNVNSYIPSQNPMGAGEIGTSPYIANDISSINQLQDVNGSLPF